VRLAREGKRVARLKGGDPMVFGRAGEELAALRKAGIRYHIVPGITSALAAAADAAMSPTLRKVSSGVVFATAHGASDTDLSHWSALAASGLTLGLYMGKEIAATTAGRLIAHGLAARTPVGIVVNAGRSNRTFHTGILGELSRGAQAFADGPAIIFVGEAVAHGDWQDAVPLAAEHYKVA
jgi:uroporphyrin-III C-methyltransferase/precorrin-2 dehydrogenase/sirohydrochlorin ferrochelatase